ncbi:MAG TPA: cytochrome c [Thermoanaerobaculia bacterium]|nr:cytochrome c [Thermoanaerobaculia bacterium]
MPRSLAFLLLIALAGLVALLAAVALPAAGEVDRSKLPPEPAGFRLDGDLERGAVVFRKSCALCHGPEGKGDGRIKSDPPPRDLTDPKALKTATDWELYQVIAEGGQVLGLAPKMLPWKDMLDEQELRDVAAYVRSLAPRK